MAVNFLDISKGFQVEISSDGPAQPGWEAGNLLSTAKVVSFSSAQKKGFMAANFLKPPVSISISFRNPAVIQIKRIIFCPRINNQCSLAASISVRRSSHPERLCFIAKTSWDEATETVIFDGSANFSPHNILPYARELVEGKKRLGDLSVTAF